jgi:Coenzyme PQQ synthesis protein D (PqqD)
MISADAMLIRDSEAATATVNDEVFMLSIRAGAYFGFNAAGSEIWRLLAQPRRVGELYEALSNIFDADMESISRDTGPFLQALLDRRLVRIVDPGPPK